MHAFFPANLNLLGANVFREERIMSEPYGEQPAVPWTSQKVASKKCVFFFAEMFC